MLFHIYRNFDDRLKINKTPDAPTQGPSTSSNEKETKTKEVTKTIAQGTKDVLGWVWNRGEDIWYGSKEAIFDTKQGEIDDIVKSCHEAGLNFTVENIESDQKNAPRYRVKVDIHNQSNDVSLDEETKKQRQDIKDRINAKPATDDNPEVLNNMVAKAVIKNMNDVLIAPRTEAEKHAQVALYTFFYQRQKNAVLEKGLVITPALLNEAFRSAGSNLRMFDIPQISSFKNLYLDGRGIITDEKFNSDSFSPLSKAVSEMALFGTNFVDLDQKSVLRDFTEKIPEKVRDGFFNLHPVEKMIVIGAAVYFFFFSDDKTKNIFRKTALYGSLVWVGSRWFTGKNPAELVGWLGGNASKLYENLTQGSYGPAMEKMMNFKPEDPDSVRRMQSIMVMGQMSIEDIVNNYDPAKGRFDESALTHEQIQFIKKFLKDEASNKGVAQDWDERVSISDMLNHFFFYVGEGDRNKGYDTICKQYLKKEDGQRWKIDTAKWGDKLTFFQVMVQSINPADLKKTDASGAARDLRAKEFENRDANEVTQRFKRQGIDLKYITRIDHGTREFETASGYFLGGWQTELEINGNRASLTIMPNGPTIVINDINAITSDEKNGQNGIKGTIESFANTELGRKVALTGIQYNVETGEYQGVYLYERSDWKVLFKAFGGNNFYAIGTGKENNIETYTDYFDPGTGRSRALLVDRTQSPEVRGYPLTQENIETVISHTGNVKAINESLGKLPYDIEWNNIRKNEKNGYTITITNSVILEADAHFEIFNFQGQSATFPKNELGKKLGEQLTSDDAIFLLAKKISNVYGTEAIFLKAKGDKPDRLYLKDFEIDIPLDTTGTTGMQVEGGVITRLYGEKVDYENGDFTKKTEKNRGFKNTFIKRAIVGKYFKGDKDFEITELNGTRITVRCDTSKNNFAPSTFSIDVRDLRNKDGGTDPALPNRIGQMMYVMSLFEGYEVKSVDIHRTTDENDGKVTGMTLMIGSYENRTEADDPAGKMLWKVDVGYNADGTLKSYKVKQLLGSPNLEAYLAAENGDPNKKGDKTVSTLVKDANKALSDSLVKEYTTDPFEADAENIYNSVYDTGAAHLLRRKNELHALQKTKEYQNVSKANESKLDSYISNTATLADYQKIYSSYQPRYQTLLDDTPTTSNPQVLTVRYLLLRKFNDDASSHGFDLERDYSDEIGKRLTKISNVTDKEAQYYLKYPALIQIYSNLLLNPHRIEIENIGPAWISRLLDYVNDPGFSDVMEAALGLFVYMEENEVPFADQTEVQLAVIKACESGNTDQINSIISKVKARVKEHAYYVTPTNWSKAYNLFKEGKDEVFKPFAWNK